MIDAVSQMSANDFLVYNEQVFVGKPSRLQLLVERRGQSATSNSHNTIYNFILFICITISITYFVTQRFSRIYVV